VNVANFMFFEKIERLEVLKNKFLNSYLCTMLEDEKINLRQFLPLKYSKMYVFRFCVYFLSFIIAFYLLFYQNKNNNKPKAKADPLEIPIKQIEP